MESRKSLFEDLQEQHDLNISFRYFCILYCFHPGGESLRLNHKGIKFLSDFYPCHAIDVVDKNQSKKTMPSKHYVFLGKYCKMPYYIGEHHITVLDEDAAFLFKLCDGDIDNVKTVTD